MLIALAGAAADAADPMFIFALNKNKIITMKQFVLSFFAIALLAVNSFAGTGKPVNVAASTVNWKAYKVTGSHEGYREPIKQWTPSIAPTELVQLPVGKFGKYSGGLAMGTLRQASLVFMRYENGKVLDNEIVSVGARIRDLEVLPDQRLIASTDDGRLMVFSSPSN